MKRFALIAAGIAALAASGISGAAAEDICTAAGCAGTYGDGVYADGDAGNPDPLDGWVTVTSGGACADDVGSPGDPDGTPTCGP